MKAFELRAVATDQPSNSEAAGLQADSTLEALVVVDRTPPRIVAKRKADTVEVEVEDLLSAVARLEITAGGRVLFSPRCLDGVCDAREETFRFLVPHAAPGDAWTLRATDIAGNEAELPVPAP